MITFIKTIKKSREYNTRFIASRVVVINEYRSFYIDVKDVIAFTFLKIKKIYNSRHQYMFFKIKNLLIYDFIKVIKFLKLRQRK